MKTMLPKLALILAASVTLSACAGGARPVHMTSSPTEEFDIDYNNRYYKAITVEGVSGGQSTIPIWVSKVGNEAFYTALESSLVTHGMLDTDGSGKYLLSAELVELGQPLVGISLSVTSTVEYTLKNREDGSEVLRETIIAEGKATPIDSAVAPWRLRIANERSINNNITAFIKRLMDRLEL